ncbi:MAG: urease accessory protein UreD, partial [Acidimicrobiia bacterium]|nr:urease accessory protein UreD [Acidimicrobiia bacterium]
LESVGGRSRVTTLRNDPPFTFRPTPDGPFPGGVVWVGTAAGPVGGDELRLRVNVGPEAELRLTSVAASLVLPGPRGDTSATTTTVTVANGARLWWLPEPTIVAAEADHRADTTVRLGDGVELVWVEEVVLGRHGETAGRLRSRLRIEGRAGVPLLCSGLDTGRPGWDGPAGLAGCRAVAQVVLLGPPADRMLAAGTPLVVDDRARLALSPLAGGGAVAAVAGPSTLAVRRAVACLVERAAG